MVAWQHRQELGSRTGDNSGTM